MKKSLFVRHKFLLLGLIIFISAVCGFFLSRISLEETILTMVPQSVHRQVELFTLSPLNQKIFVGVQAADETEALQSAGQLRQMLVENQAVRAPFVLSAQLAQVLAGTLAYHFSAGDEKKLALKITPTAVSEKMADNYDKLLSLQGIFLRPFILQDPLDFISLMTQKLALLGEDMQVDFKDGFLSSPDGKIWIGIYDSLQNANDFSAALSFDRTFWKMADRLPSSVRAFYTGGLRYTVENVRAIKRDLVKISILALVLLSGIFALFFRRKSALLIYLLPLLILPPAALGTYLIFGRLSGITLGFGSVAAGLAVDYSVYLFFAVRASGISPYLAAEKLKKHLLCNYLTSVLCFAALLCAGVEVFRQIAVFSMLALTFALGISYFVFPAHWEDIRPMTTPLSVCRRNFLSRKQALFVTLLILCFGAWGFCHTHFTGDMNKLNALSPRFAEDKALFEEVFSGAENNRALLFVLGNSKEEVLKKSETLSARLPRPLAVSGLLLSDEETQKSLARWQQFWSAQRKQEVSNLLEKSCRSLGLKCSAFEPFLKGLAEIPPTDPFDFSQIYNPLVQLKNGQYALVHIVPNDTAYQPKDPSVVFVSAEGLQKEIIRSAKKEALRILLLAVLFNFVAVWGMLKSWKSALLSFLPVVTATSILFGCFALFRIEVNLFVLVFMPLLIGLGIDYAIFQLIKHTHDNRFYPDTAVVAAGLSTLAGFGVLAISTHPVLFMMGFSSVIGITGAVLSSVFLLAPFVRERV